MTAVREVTDPHGHEHHDHGHAHGHEHGHAHGVNPNADFRKVGAALALVIAFLIVEFALGIVAHSMTLVSDSGHMVTDAAALGFSMYVIKLVQRAATGEMTYGYRRYEVLAGFANGLTMVLLAAFMAYGAVIRLAHPVTVHGSLMLVVGTIGIVVNVAATWLVARANRQSMNIDGSYRHMLSDLFAFIGTVVAAIIITLTGFNRADPMMSLIVAYLMLKGGTPLVRHSAKIFLQATPESINVDAIRQEILALAGVVNINDMHVWEVNPGFSVFTVNVVVTNASDCDEVQNHITAIAERHGLHHHTIQVDREAEELPAYTH